ncbi:MarR family transcriptional regulator [Paraburkholderia sp. UYCP14C]|uniref:MarR family winged helix-turn-helix transcriptional regulator n=1 Tax=Paraburkholderia sp. UYCP14C TaxID=2511130 RepID=UPI001020F0AA|nr:MarR family transcriptional regulator [Paraburkholderia sp. UYCP14C]RZF31544.1 MarR family transcriptional regulator [Paraburkholderia sp. UYCP14C]
MQGSRQKRSAVGPSRRKPARAARTSPVSDVEAHVGYWLRLVSNHVSHGFQTKMEAHGVTVSEWVLLREIYASGPTSATALAARTGISKGAVSRLLARIEAKGLLERETVDEDRRNHLIALSDAARALVPELAQLGDQNDDEFFGHLPAQVRTAIVDVMKNVVAVHGLKNASIE